MKWFFALNERSHAFEQYATMIKVAVHTALTRTSLVPYFLYDGQENALTLWLRERGVVIISCRTSFYTQLEAFAARTQNPYHLSIGAGAFMRTDLPRLALENGLEDRYVLYTDCDIMFQSDVVPALNRMTPRYFAGAPESVMKDFLDLNTGVVLMNLDALRREDKRFLPFVHRHLEQIIDLAWDQGAYRTYYTPLWRLLMRLHIPNRYILRLSSTRLRSFIRYRWNPLPQEYNWKPYWGISNQVKIIHFHGPKPYNRFLLGQPVPPEYHQLRGGAYQHYCEEWDKLLRVAA